MKKTILCVLAIFFSIALISAYKTHKSKSPVPEAVVDSFQLRYPGANQAKWENCDRIYKVRFQQEGKEKEAAFLFSGDLIDSVD